MRPLGLRPLARQAKEEEHLTRNMGLLDSNKQQLASVAEGKASESKKAEADSLTIAAAKEAEDLDRTRWEQALTAARKATSEVEALTQAGSGADSDVQAQIAELQSQLDAAKTEHKTFYGVKARDGCGIERER